MLQRIFPWIANRLYNILISLIKMGLKRQLFNWGKEDSITRLKKKTKQTLNECLSEKTVAQVTAMNQSI